MQNPAKVKAKNESKRRNSKRELSGSVAWKNPLERPLLRGPHSYLKTQLEMKSATKSLGKDRLSAQLFVVSGGSKALSGLISKVLSPHQRKRIRAELEGGNEVIHVPGDRGSIWFICRKPAASEVSHLGLLEESDYSWHRDRVGSWFTQVRSQSKLAIKVHFVGSSDEARRGAFVGIELSAYRYKEIVQAENEKAWLAKLCSLVMDRKMSADPALQEAIILGQAMNISRHLVNCPPNELNPQSFEELVLSRFAKQKDVKIEVWHEERLRNEGMGLLLGVGQGGLHGPRLVHIKYRPGGSPMSSMLTGKKTSKPAQDQAKGQLKPIAFVGKGITFDTGGLDIKPSSGMRLMKKDMGGAATVLGIADWAVSSQYPGPLDFYIPLAENSVDRNSFRPSDVLIARNGLAVEIHNTDAEGRLILADAMDVAVSAEGADEPEVLVDIATLTGAIKVALGAEIGGLFSNHDPLAKELESCAQKAGDLVWRMPLYSKYSQTFSTPFADLVNAVDGWGGPITAALFLEKFVRRKVWAHLDIYAWTDKADGPFSSAGGNAQTLQCLVEYLKRRT